MSTIVLLGPQNFVAARASDSTLSAVVEEIAPEGPLILVTAGWQQREAADDELRALLRGRELRNLELFERSELVHLRETALASDLDFTRERQRQVHRYYRRRLDHTLAAVTELQQLEDGDDLAARALEQAVESVRVLDSEHLEQIAGVRGENVAKLADPPPTLARQRRKVDDLLEGAAAILVAGGHVGTLLDCLELFDLTESFKSAPVIAWSAGAMVLGKRVVLFHDRPPWGAGNAECFAHGLGVYDDVLVFPHARSRLRLRDRRRVDRMAARFAPLACLGLDQGSMARRSAQGWQVRKVTRLKRGGAAEPSGRDDWEGLSS